MNWLTRPLLLFVGILRWPLRMWVRLRVTPSDRAELAIDPDKPVCYILKKHSLSDRLVLESACKAHGLPRPRLPHNRLPDAKRAMVMALPAAGDRAHSDLQRLTDYGIEHPDYAVQVIPVSIFWGRDPIRETSLFKILFADSPRAGRLRKCLIVLAQGRKTLLHFGQPLDYDAVTRADADATLSTRKLTRVLRVHYQRQRTATLGPRLSQRHQVINSLLADQPVIEAIRRTADAEEIDVNQVRIRARGYAEEIAADYSPIAIGFMLRVVSWLWNRLYDGIDVRHLQQLRHTARDKSVIYLPAHRSHIDYLLISYILYTEGLALPQIAAGINLNFWPVGPLLRRGGAFYIRRKFRGNRLYGAVFRAYVDVLIRRGYPMEFFPEGGRSRTGRLLAPRTGMLSMVAQSAAQHGGRRTVVVPVYVGYDRVMEVNSYFAELRGAQSKKKESVLDLVRGARKALQRKYGRAYVSFGAPLHLDEYITGADNWLEVTTLAEQVMTGINSAASLNAAGLVALVLLGSPQKAVAEKEMIHTLDHLVDLARRCPYSDLVTVPDASGQALLAEAEPLVRLERIPHAWGDVLTLESRESVLLTYTRNSVMHLFALPSLIANMFVQPGRWDEQALLDACIEFYPILASELFLRWHADAVREELARVVAGMVEAGLLEAIGDGEIMRPPVGTDTFATLMNLAHIMRESLERYCMTTVLLASNLDAQAGEVERAAFECQCQLMAERMAILTGRNSPEFFDLGLFRNHVRTLTQRGLLTARGNALHIDAKLQDLANHAMELLGPDIRQSIQHLIHSEPGSHERNQPDA